MPREKKRTGLLPSGSWTSKASRAAKAKKCQPVDDCEVKNTLRGRTPLMQPAKKPAWPNAGRYEPKKERGR